MYCITIIYNYIHAHHTHTLPLLYIFLSLQIRKLTNIICATAITRSIQERGLPQVNDKRETAHSNIHSLHIFTLTGGWCDDAPAVKQEINRKTRFRFRCIVWHTAQSSLYSSSFRLVIRQRFNLINSAFVWFVIKFVGFFWRHN